MTAHENPRDAECDSERHRMRRSIRPTFANDAMVAMISLRTSQPSQSNANDGYTEFSAFPDFPTNAAQPRPCAILTFGLSLRD
jgi:hypothetical protein